MPLNLNVGVTKKRGLPDYGSVGASCGVSLELDASLLEHDHDGFQRRVEEVFAACSRAVDLELTRQQAGDNNSHPVAAESSHKPAGNGNGQPATAKQLNYIGQLAGQIGGLDPPGVENLFRRLFDKPKSDLSSLEASSLIDTLKSVKSGELPLGEILGEAAA